VKKSSRSGKRKCKRCKELFLRKKGDPLLCERCRFHCSRCDSLLTLDEIKDKQTHCNNCSQEVAINKENNVHNKDYALLRTYGITYNEYLKLLEDQNGLCWICRKPPMNISLSVDHKHEAGENKKNPRRKRHRVRGLLCWLCNTALRHYFDDPILLRRAAEYLEVLPAQKVLYPEHRILVDNGGSILPNINQKENRDCT